MRFLGGSSLVLVAGLLSSCQLLGGGEGPERALAQLEDGLTNGELAGVPVDVRDLGTRYRLVLEPLGEDVTRTVEAGEPAVDGDTAAAPLTWTWDLGEQEWTYATDVALTRTGADDSWVVAWDPSIVEPTLEEGERLDLRRTPAPRGRILGAGGRAVVAARDVVRLGLDKTRLPAGQVAASARRIASVLDLDVRSFVERAEASGEAAFVEAIVMRTEDARQEVPPSYGDIAGAVALDDQLPLAPTRTFAAPILGSVGEATAEVVEESEGRIRAGDLAGLSGLQGRYDEQLAGRAGLEVLAVPEEGEARVLHEIAPTPGEPLRTTLDIDLQTRAEQALAGVGPPSALVALRVSDGAILAAASGPGSGGLNTATYGQYAPGSTFKVVTTLALLRAGLSPSSSVECNAASVVDGKSFENYDDYPAAALGDIALRTAFANSCNTAFINARGKVRGSALADAAAALGLGVDHDIGFPAYFGQVTAPESETGAAAGLIGQGTVLASPLAMAAVGASVVAGEAVLPTLLPDHDVRQQQPAQPLTQGEAAALRDLMRAVVTDGSGAVLADVGVDGAKTGTAEFGEPARDGELATHAWMLATRGDLAVVAFVEEGASGSRTAGPLLEAFLS